MTDILARAREIDERYHAFITIADSLEAEGDGRLSGYAVSVKDNVCTEGMQTTAGSRILEGYVPPFDATVVAKCRAEGAFILGKTTQDEFGFGTFNVNTPYSVPLNPHDPEKSCGGSSGGAACLTAVADFPHVAISESTGGSISCPASFCGVVGIKPTLGLVSRDGIIPASLSFDVAGPIARSVRGAAVMLGVRGFEEGRQRANLDALAGDAYEMAVDAQKWMRKPEFFGGGGNCSPNCNWSSATIEAFGYATQDDGNYHSYHGFIEIDPQPEELVIQGTNTEMGQRVTIRVRGMHPDSIYTVIEPVFQP